jgi:hypothetical protein
MTDRSTRWIARLVPTTGTSAEALLQTPLGLDVWEHRQGELVVAATEEQLQEIERRRLAQVERIEPVSDYLTRQEPENR